MPSFLIVHAATADGRIDGFRQPPTLDIGGWRAPLDWGDVTLHVPAGDLIVTIFVTRTEGHVEGARITVRTPAGTGTRLTFVPPLHPGGLSQLRIEGQWPSDSSMYYYAARDARVLAAPQPAPAARRPQRQPAPQQPSAPQRQSVPHQQAVPHQRAVPQSQPAPQDPGELGVRVVSPAAQPVAEVPTTAVGPTPGSSASVPQQPTSFGHEQGARVDPVQATPPPSEQTPGHPGVPTHPTPSPSFGQREPNGRASAPRITTPAEFSRLEDAAREAQLRAYEAWQAQQQPTQPAGPPQHDGAPEPIGLGSVQTGQASPDWYPDPYRRADARWFDGRQWTASVMRGGVRGTDPLA